MLKVNKNMYILDINPIDHKWRVLKDGVSMGEGDTSEAAVKSARKFGVLDPIYQFNLNTGGYVEVSSHYILKKKLDTITSDGVILAQDEIKNAKIDSMFYREFIKLGLKRKIREE